MSLDTVLREAVAAELAPLRDRIAHLEAALETPRALTMHQAAQLLGVSYATVNRMVVDGRLPAFRDGRTVRISPRIVERLLAGERFTDGQVA